MFWITSDRGSTMAYLYGLCASLLLALLMSLPWLASASPAAADGPTVPIQDLAFPLEVAIGAGETVTWVNEEPVIPHDVIETNQAFASPMLQPGEAFSHTFSEPGVYE